MKKCVYKHFNGMSIEHPEKMYVDIILNRPNTIDICAIFL